MIIFWVSISLLTAVGALTILIPLTRARSKEVASANADEAVYREQLSSIESELERGLIDAETAKAARTETARRLLAAHERSAKTQVISADSKRLQAAKICALVLLPAIVLGTYIFLGSPEMEDQPLLARLSAPTDQQPVDVLVARVERHLSENPQDGEGWAILAPVYLTIGQPSASARAYSNAIRILGPREDWLSDMGEALTVANQGVVTTQATEAFQAAIEIDPNAVKPRFFLAIALAQEGRKEDAINAWESLLEGAPESALWVNAAKRELAGLKEEGATASSSSLRGPTQEDISAAQTMSAEDQQVMIQGMVAGLAERLEADGGSVQEWARLIQAYAVLGEREKAIKAFRDASEVFSEQPNNLNMLEETATRLGLSDG